jgi:hypothetical protein
MNQFGALGYSIWDTEFGDHKSSLEREQNALLISGYLEANLGELNILINTDFQYDSESDTITPTLQQEEEAIMTQMYMKDYLHKEGRNTLKNAQSTDAWVELREGDSSVKRTIASATAKNTSAKIFYDLAKAAQENLTQMVHSYNVYGSVPLQIKGKDA